MPPRTPTRVLSYNVRTGDRLHHEIWSIPSEFWELLCGGQPLIFTTKNSRSPPARSQRGEREEGCRLAKREQPQWVRDRRQEVAISERGKSNGRVAMREQLQ